MRSGLLLLAAVSLSGVLLNPAQAAHIEPQHGLCLQWLEEKQQDKTPSTGNNHEDTVALVHKHEMIPKCDDHGNFLPQQCHKFTMNDELCLPSGECFHFKEDDEWCVCMDPMSGTLDMSSITRGTENLRCGSHGEMVHTSQAVMPPTVMFCDRGWTYFRDHNRDMCYKFIDSPKTWVQAEGYCQFEGGNLASIHCSETNHFLQTLTRGDSHNFPLTWVGGHNAIQACFWMWSDGKKFDFESWSKQESKDREHSCLRINEGCQMKWSSGCCNETLPFVCERGWYYPYYPEILH